jgi:hypothetical protein
MSDWATQSVRDGTGNENEENSELLVDAANSGSCSPKLYTASQMVYSETPFMLSQLPFWDPQSFESALDRHIGTQETASACVQSQEVRFAPPSSAEDYLRRSSTSSQKDDSVQVLEERHQVRQFKPLSV